MDTLMQKCHSIIVTGKVQDIGFRSVVEHIGRKLDKANLLLLSGFENLNKDLNRGFDNLTTIMLEQNMRMDEHNTRLEAMQKEHNAGHREHNTRLEAILEKLANK